jgi:excisionase family DNA binding protein
MLPATRRRPCCAWQSRRLEMLRSYRRAAAGQLRCAFCPSADNGWRMTSGATARGGLDRAGEGERGCTRRRITPPPGALGRSNRLLTVDEVADFLGVPKKTVYACWRDWGLKAYKVGRHLRFRQRHVEDWLDRQEV